MRLLALTVATASVLAFAYPQIPQVLAQSRDDGAVGPTLRLDGGPPLGTDNRGQTSNRSERTEPPIGASSEKGQASIEKTGQGAIRGRSHTHVGWNSRAKHRFVIHRRGHHIFAFHAPRHRFFVIHRHGRRFVAFNERSTV
jgi:hypothetical protein